jgi:hypothetical protein
MKNTSKFLAVMLAITGLFCCAVAVGIGAGFNAVRESTDKKIIAVAEKVREQYPDISEKELAQILNSDTAGIKGDFAKYGIKSDSGWVDIQSGSYATITIVIATAGVCVFGILLCVVFIRYCKKQKRQRLEIVKCLEKINNREYDLDLDGSTDDDMSLLKQEIQKTTVMLREYADNSMREKEILKNSLADISHQLKTPLTSILMCFSLYLQPVTKALYGFNHICIKFFAKSFYVHGQRVVLNIIPRQIPYAFKNLFTGQHLAAVFGKHCKQAVLKRRKHNGIAVFANLFFVKVNADVAKIHSHSFVELFGNSFNSCKKLTA